MDPHYDTCFCCLYIFNDAKYVWGTMILVFVAFTFLMMLNMFEGLIWYFVFYLIKKKKKKIRFVALFLALENYLERHPY